MLSLHHFLKVKLSHGSKDVMKYATEGIGLLDINVSWLSSWLYTSYNPFLSIDDNRLLCIFVTFSL